MSTCTILCRRSRRLPGRHFLCCRPSDPAGIGPPLCLPHVVIGGSTLVRDGGIRGIDSPISSIFNISESAQIESSTSDDAGTAGAKGVFLKCRSRNSPFLPCPVCRKPWLEELALIIRNPRHSVVPLARMLAPTVGKSGRCFQMFPLFPRKPVSSRHLGQVLTF